MNSDQIQICLFFVFFFFFFSQKIRFEISCKLFPKETICMNSQNLLSGRKKKKKINILSAEIFIQHTKY